MSEVVVFPDALEAFTDYLRDELNGWRGWTVTVGTQIPTTRPAQIVRLLRTGGTHHFDPGVPVELVQLTVECWAATQATAHDLVQIARALVFASRGTVDGVSRVEEVGGPGYLPDPLSDQPRYSFTVQVTWRGFTESGS